MRETVDAVIPATVCDFVLIYTQLGILIMIFIRPTVAVSISTNPIHKTIETIKKLVKVSSIVYILN